MFKVTDRGRLTDGPLHVAPHQQPLTLDSKCQGSSGPGCCEQAGAQVHGALSDIKRLDEAQDRLLQVARGATAPPGSW